MSSRQRLALIIFRCPRGSTSSRPGLVQLRGASEWSFLVSEGALKRLQPNVERNEARLLLAFDTHRAAIHAVAITTYKRERKGSYQLLAVDFYPRDGGGLSYENYLPETSFPIVRTRSNTDGTGALFFLFFSAFGFFFSRLLLNWPFATVPSLRLRWMRRFSLPAYHSRTCTAV